MAVVTENQGTASLCHLEGKEALKNVHSSFNALKHLIWFAYTMNDSVGDTQEDKSTIFWVEESRCLKEKTSRSRSTCNLSLQLLTIINSEFHFPTSNLSNI